MGDQRKTVRDDGLGHVAIDEAGIFLRLGELQQLGDDLVHAVGLLVDQPEFRGGILCLFTDDGAEDFEIALDDRDRIVDLVRDARGDFADCGELFRHDQLFRRRLQLPVGVPQFARALVDAGIQLLVPFAQLPVALLDSVEKIVEMECDA